MATKKKELPDIRPDMGYQRRIPTDHIVNDPKNSHLAFKVVNNENGEMQRHLRQGWRVWMEEVVLDYDFDPDADDDQTNRVKKGASRYPVGIGKNGIPIDAYLLYCSKESYNKALAILEKAAVAQVEMVHQGKVQEGKKAALEKSLGGHGLTKASVMESSLSKETKYTNTIAST